MGASTMSAPLPVLVGLQGTTLLPAEEEALRRLQPRGVLLFKRNVVSNAQLEELCAKVTGILQESSDLPLIAADHEGGPVSVLGAAVGIPPSARALGLADDPELTRRVHKESARRARRAGVNFLLAPVADVDRPGNPVIGIRAFSQDSTRVATQVKAAVRGLREGGVYSCAKHWPGHGSPSSDSHQESASVTIELKEWQEIDLPPFRAAVAAGVSALMVGHLAFAELDRSGVIAPLSRRILEECRRSLGFEGLLLSDALEMEGFGGADPADALDAGIDLLLFGKTLLSLKDELSSLAERLKPHDGRVYAFPDAPQDPPETADAEAYVRARTSGVCVHGPLAWDRKSWVLWDGVSGDRLYPFADWGSEEQSDASLVAGNEEREEGESSLELSLSRALQLTAREIGRWDPHENEFQNEARLERIPWPEKGEGLLIASLRPLARPLLDALQARLSEPSASPAWVICLGVLPAPVTESQLPWLHLPGLCERDFKLLSPILQGGVDRGQPRC